MVSKALSSQSFEEIIDIETEDLNWTSVKLSDVISRKYRLEASVFDIEGKHARDVLEECKWDLVNLCGKNGLAISYRPKICKRIFVEKENGIPTYTPSQITELNPKPQKYLSPNTNTDLSDWFLKEGEVLLTCSGTIGNVSLVTKTLKGKCFSQNLIRIVPNDDETGSYIYAFLRTKIGNKLVQTNNYGAVIKHIDPEHLENIPIPKPPNIIRREIHERIMLSFKLRDEANSLLDKAWKLLKDELDLPEIDNIKPRYFDNSNNLRCFSTKLSELNNRFEASYHVPIVRKIIERIKEKAERIVRIGNEEISKKIILPGRFKRIYVEENQGWRFAGGKEINTLYPNNLKYLSTKFHRSRIERELRIKENTILITRSGTIGKVVLVPKHWENLVLNEHIIRVIPKENKIAGYMYVFLSSDYGVELIKRFTYGSVVNEIDDSHVGNVVIPILKNKDIQKKINDLALEANNKRYKAYLLEQEAIDLTNKKVIFNSK